LFNDEAIVVIENINEEELSNTLEGSMPVISSISYTEPFIAKNAVVKVLSL
jgi:hypothetical protein